MDANQILELEKKYQNILNEFINSNIFKKDLYNIEKAIKSSYPKLKNTYESKQKASSALEKLLSLSLPKWLKAETPFPLPICSDIALMNEEAVIWVDAKSYDLHGNKGDKNSQSIGKNQVTIPSIPKFKNLIKGLHGNDFTFPGFPFNPPILKVHKNAITENKPILTYFISLWSFDDHKSFAIKEVELQCIPHFLVYKNNYPEDIYSSTKNYQYIGEKMSENKILKPYEKLDFPEKFRIVQYRGEHSPKEITKNELENIFNKKGSKKHESIALVDLENKNPVYKDAYLIRKFQNKKWRVVISFSGGRINKNKLRKNYKNNGKIVENEWRLQKVDL